MSKWISNNKGKSITLSQQFSYLPFKKFAVNSKSKDIKMISNNTNSFQKLILNIQTIPYYRKSNPTITASKAKTNRQAKSKQGTVRWTNSALSHQNQDMKQSFKKSRNDGEIVAQLHARRINTSSNLSSNRSKINLMSEGRTETVPNNIKKDKSKGNISNSLITSMSNEDFHAKNRTMIKIKEILTSNLTHRSTSYHKNTQQYHLKTLHYRNNSNMHSQINTEYNTMRSSLTSKIQKNPVFYAKVNKKQRNNCIVYHNEGLLNNIWNPSTQESTNSVRTKRNNSQKDEMSWVETPEEIHIWLVKACQQAKISESKFE